MTLNAEATVQLAAPLLRARDDRQVRLVAGLFWVSVAILLLGGVAVGIILGGNLSMTNARGDIVAGICIAAFGGAGICAVKAIKRLFPRA